MSYVPRDNLWWFLDVRHTYDTYVARTTHLLHAHYTRTWQVRVSMSTCVVRGAQVAPTPNLQHTYYTPTSIMCGAYAPRMRDLRVECWECELNEKKKLFWGKTYKNLSIHAEIFPIFPAYKSTLRAGDAYVAPTRHVGASRMEKILRHAWCKMFWNCFRFLSYNRSTRTLIAATRARLAWASQGNLPFFARRPVVEARTTNCKWALTSMTFCRRP